MKCPFCSHNDTQVVETRLAEDGDLIRRRRQCAACEKRFTTYERKRPVSIEQVDSAIERIEEKLLNLAQREVASNKIGELVMRELKKLDKVAYVRFASVYRSFEDIDDFKLLVDEVSK